MENEKIPLRSEVPEAETWDLRDLFPTDEAWLAEYEALKTLPERAAAFQGKLGRSAEDLLLWFRLQDEIQERLSRLHTYASCKSDQDTGNGTYQDFRGKAMGTYVAVLSACAFATPEIMAIDDDTLNLFYAAQPELLGYQRSLYQIRRRKAHILSPECEKLLAAAGEMADSPDRISSTFRDADLTFPPVVDSEGRERTLTDATYIPMLMGSDRALRKTAREAKEALSSAPQFTAIVTSLASRGIQRVTLHREEYEARIEPVVRRAVDLAEKALREAKIWQSPDLTVLMVGGSTYIPLVRRLLQERFPWLDSKTQVVQRLPDQAVALGCALFAERPLADRKVRFAYAIKAYRGNSDEQFLYVCIPMNCTLPCSVSGRFSTRLQEQDNVALKIFEVDHGAPLERIPVKEGRFTQLIARHSFGKPVPKGTSVLVTTELSKDGLLTLTVDDGGISTQGITRHTFDIVRSLDD